MREYKVDERLLLRGREHPYWVTVYRMRNRGLEVETETMVFTLENLESIFDPETLTALICAAERALINAKVAYCEYAEDIYNHAYKTVLDTVPTMKERIAAVESAERELALLNEAKRLLEEEGSNAGV